MFHVPLGISNFCFNVKCLATHTFLKHFIPDTNKTKAVQCIGDISLPQSLFSLLQFFQNSRLLMFDLIQNISDYPIV